MKQLSIVLCILLLLLAGCAPRQEASVAATTLPVYEFTARLCKDTGLTVTRLVTENVSCLHDYTLKVDQMRALEGARLVVINGAGLESFLDDALTSAHKVVDASQGLTLMEGAHDHDHDHGHVHEDDPHIWLSPENAKVMAENICAGLSAEYPEHSAAFRANLAALVADLDKLQADGEALLSGLRCRELITFHDGFGYLAESFGLTVLQAVEEESGSEASAAQLIGLVELIEIHHIPAVFTEINGSVSAAGIISAETGVEVRQLDMAMAGDSYFDSMYHNIHTLQEALQ